MPVFSVGTALLCFFSGHVISFKSCLMVSIQFFLGLAGLPFFVFTSQCMTCCGSLPWSVPENNYSNISAAWCHLNLSGRYRSLNCKYHLFHATFHATISSLIISSSSSTMCKSLQVYELLCTTSNRPICSFLQRVWRSDTSAAAISHSSSCSWPGQHHTTFPFRCILNNREERRVHE